MYLLYSALLAAGLLLTLPYWLWQMSRHGKYHAGLRQRLGQVPERLASLPGRPVIWIHAVSVGELLAVSGLVSELRQRHPQHRLLISTITDTGYHLAEKHFGEENVFYFPMDFSFAIKPYLRRLRPELIVIAETEFWPNFLRLAHATGARIAVVNARISDRSFPRYRRWRLLLTRVLQSVDLFLAQTREDADRLREIGAPAGRVRVSGNLKFDVPPPPLSPIVASLRTALQDAGPIFVCGSTAEGEESILLRAFANILADHPRAVMLLAPRHPQRFGDVAGLLQSRGMSFIKRSSWNGEALAGRVLLVDTIGELAALYSLADIAFVGGSLLPRGGHNIIEPAQYGVPIVVGPHTENFRDIVGLFQSRDAVRVAGEAEISAVFLELISNPATRAALGQRATETLHSQVGATKRTADALGGLLRPAPAITSNRGAPGRGARATS
jgi:3-deoxy-D-manno-octulosonic-acid transferase